MLKWKINRKVDLSGDAPDVERLKALATLSTRIAHELRISVQENKKDADLSGFKVMLSVILPDQSSLMDAFDGAVDGCKVLMTLPDICYSQKGEVKGVLYLGDDGGGLLPIYAFVLRNIADLTDIFVDTANVVPSIGELLLQMQTMRELTQETQTARDEAIAETARVGAVREDAEQAVEDAQRAILATQNWGNVTVTVSMLLPNELPVVTISDTGTGKTMAFALPRGLTGLTPNLRIGTVTTLSEGEQASATITGTAEAPVLNLWIPRGYTGRIENMPFGTEPPSALGETASPGVSDRVARSDHVHPMPSASDLLDMIYPIGSIYISTNETSPAAIFGGTWEQLKDRFLLGAGSYSAGSTGGEETHKLTTAEMPSHTHNVKRYTATGEETGNALQTVINVSATFDSVYGALAAGGGNAHNNMPPYLAVCMWERVS